MTKTILSVALCLLFANPSFSQTTFTHAECGTEFTLALRSDSTLWTCGNNANGQLGNDTTVKSDVLLQVAPGQKWIYAATGAFHSMAIASDSTLWGWGLNGNGQLGTATTSTAQLPTQVNTTQRWTYVSGGEVHTIAILDNGTLWGTGDNYYGQLGTGDTTQHLSFVQIGTANNWKTVSAGGLFTLAIKNDGTLWGWGYNGDGELGMGNTGTYLSPTQIGTDTNWVMASGGYEFSLAMKSDGSIWSTGFNGNGQLGRVTTGINDSAWAQIGTTGSWKFIAVGASYGLAIQQNGTLWGWGFNEYGQLGISPASSADSITQVGTDNTWQYISAADGAISGGSVYGLHSAGFKTLATGLCTTGADYTGQLGNGEFINTPGAQFAFDCSVEATTPSAVANVNKSTLISVYPNPASDQLNIYGIATTATFNISNMVGSEVQKGNLQKGANTLPVENLIPGVYILTVTAADGEKYNTRFIKN